MLAIIILSHAVAYYVLLCVAKRGGRLYPLPLTRAAAAASLTDLRELAVPTPASWAAYLGFLCVQLWLALVCPGPVVYGYPVTTSGARADDAVAEANATRREERETMRRLPYTCNALAAWWVTLLCVVVGVVVFGDAPLVWVAENRGRLLTCAVLVGDAGSLLFYLKGVRSREKKTTGRFLYDFFMGAELNPRSFDGKLDWKMFAELRVSWVTLFLLTASAAAKQARSRRDAAAYLSENIGDDFLSAAARQLFFSCLFHPAVARLVSLVADARRALAVRERVPERRGVRPVHVGCVPREVRLDAPLVERRWSSVLLQRLQLRRRRDRSAAFARRRRGVVGGAPRGVLRLGRRAGAAGHVQGAEGARKRTKHASD